MTTTDWPKMHLQPSPHPAGEFCIKLGCSIETTPENSHAPYLSAILRELGIRELTNSEQKMVLLAAAVDQERLRMMAAVADLTKIKVP